MQPTPSPKIDQRCAGILLHHAVGFLRDCRPTTRRQALRHGFVFRRAKIKIGTARSWDFGSSVYQDFLSGRQQLLDVRRDWLAFFLHARDGGLDAGGVPQFERAHLPVEAHAHGAIDFDDRVGNFGNAIGGVSPEIGKRRPEKLLPLCRPSADRCHRVPASMRTRAPVSLDVLRHLERRELRFLPRMILERLPVDGQPLVLFSVTPMPFASCRSRPSFCRPATFAPAFGAKKSGSFRSLRSSCTFCCHVADDMPENVEADQIDGAEGRRLAAIPRRYPVSASTSSIDRSISCISAHDVQHGESADAVGDEVRRVFGVARLLCRGARRRSASTASIACAISFRGGNDFEQAHVTRRIEEVRAEPVAAKIFGKSFSRFWRTGSPLVLVVTSVPGLRTASTFLEADCA